MARMPAADPQIPIAPNPNRVVVRRGGAIIAAYWSIRSGPRTVENAVWSYESPYDRVAPIKGHLAFYSDRVDAIEERPATVPC